MSTTPDIKSLELQAADAIESGDPADAQRFKQATGMLPTDFQSALRSPDPSQLQLAVQAHQELSGGSTTDARMAYALSRMNKDHPDFAYRTGEVVFANSTDPEHEEALYRGRIGGMSFYYSNPDHPAFSGTTVFFKDRIPAGIEERVIMREMYQNMGPLKDATGLAILSDTVGRWESWGTSKDNDGNPNYEHVIYQAVDKRMADMRKHGALPGTKAQTQFVYAVQEALKLGIEPDSAGQRVDGWLDAVFEHAKYTIKASLGMDIPDMSSKQLLELVSFGNPFKPECDAMKAFEQAKHRADLEAQELPKPGLRFSSLPDMEVSYKGWPESKVVLAYLEGGDPELVVFSQPDEDEPESIRITTVSGWDVTDAVVDWIDVPPRPTREAEHSAAKQRPDDSPSPGM